MAKSYTHYFVVFLLCFANFCKAQIFSWKNPNIKDSVSVDSLIAKKISKDFYTKDTADFIIKSSGILEENKDLFKKPKPNILGDLNAKGSIIRGMTFGNKQGSSAQSSMDLQISGKLSKDISVLASITDHNLPIQANGYTQTLEEFDKVYMQLNIKQNSILKAGHIDLTDNKTYFGRYQRRSMGLDFSTKFGKDKLTDFFVSAGVARSEFHRIKFQAIEGNQGPYRLTGKNGENFITILSGSEQVYIDGILMKRGENLDYTINYNTGELTFTSFRPIYRQNFITVSYNYTNRNYSRYLFTGSLAHQSKNEKLKLGFNWFMESDNKNNPLSLNLTKEDELTLTQAGNNYDKMYAASGVATEYDVNKILYELKYNGTQSYYDFSTDKSKTLYQVNFTYFGNNKGDYSLKKSTNNGKIFEYVGPGNGEYSAVRKLPAPEKTQVFSANAEYQFDKGKIGFDISLSNYDKNLFSKINKQENFGFAGRFFASKTFTKNNWIGEPMFEYQRINKQFHILDRINNVDFWRDFNLQNEFNQITQNRFIFGIHNTWGKDLFLNYKINYLNEEYHYNGLKNDIDFGWRHQKFNTKASISYLNTKANIQDTKYIRANISTEYTGKKGSWSAGFAMEENDRNINLLNQKDPTSFRWKEIFAQKKIGDSARTKLMAKIYFRDNDSVRNNRLSNFNNILGLMAESQIIKTQNTQLSTTAHYRKFFNQNTSLLPQTQDFLVGNIIYNQQLFRNGMRLQTFYELGNGQEAQREFQYIKVTDGQGVYKWTDYNNDGVQQLDEFEIAEYIDLAKYIRIYTNTLRYLPSNKNKLQLALFVNPAITFNSENIFLKRWNFNIALNSQNSFFKKNRMINLNPFSDEADQILKNQNLLANIQFNPTDKSGWNGYYRYLKNRNIINANNSREENQREGHSLNLGYWFSKDFRADWESSQQSIYNHSQNFSTRNYHLLQWETKPKITYKFSNTLQAELFGAFRSKKRTDGNEFLQAYEATGTLQWDWRKTSIRGNFSFINNNFSGNSVSIIGNQMLDGLKAGKNQVWSLYIQQTISSLLQLNINYEGRNSGDRTIHIGSMQLKANF